MKRITKREVCLAVPHRWKREYEGYADDRKVAIGETLLDLRARDLTPENIAKVIGNDTWTRLECDECGSDAESVVEMAESQFCNRCLDRAFSL